MHLTNMEGNPDPHVWGVEEKYAVLFGSMATVVTLTSTVLLLACCCPKKKSLSLDSESVDEVRSVNTPAKDEEEILPKIIIDGKNSRVSVTEMVRSLETTKETNKPLYKPAKKAPQSEAFKEFESSGLIIGMGMTKKDRGNGQKTDFEIPVQIANGNDKEGNYETNSTNDENNQEQWETVTTVTTTTKTTKLPDVVHSISAEEDEFEGIERNSELLSSFRKPAPPCRRSSGKNGKRSPRKPASAIAIQKTTDPGLNEWSTVLDDFSFGPSLGSKNVAVYKKTTTEVMPDGTVVERTETSSGPFRKTAIKSSHLREDTPTIIEVEELEGVFPNDDTMCETLKRTRKLSMQKHNFSYDDSDMDTMRRKKQGQRLVKHFPVEITVEKVSKEDKNSTAANRKISRGTLVLDQYGNLVINKSS